MLVLHQAALLGALVALGFAATRTAQAIGARGLELPVAAAALGAATAGAEALGLGLFGLGGSPVALLLAALLTALVAHRATPTTYAGAALGAWWRGRSPAERRILAALAGAGLAWVAWLLKHPALAIDPLTYHMPESIRWVQHGHVGRVEELQYEFPQGNYPVTNELLVAWLTGLSHTQVPGLLWTSATALLASVAGFLGLRRLGATPAAAALAVAAVLLTPIAATQLIGEHTDLPAIAWLYATCALVVCAEREPRLLAPALVAAALSVGTKTTSAPLIVALLAWAAWRQRAHLRRMRRLLAVAAALAVAAGGVWYIRNWVDHGSPLWPFVAFPGGDPIPPFLERLDTSFLDNPGPTWERNASAYVDVVAGGFLVLLAGLIAPLTRPRKPVVIAAAAAVVALCSWLTAPFTGFAGDGVIDASATTIRYLLPALSAAAAAAALARRTPLTIVLAIAAVWSVAATQDLPIVGMPSTATLLAGAALGALLLTRRVAWVAVLAAGAIVPVAAAAGFAERQARAPWLRSQDLVAWAAEQPRWRDEDFPIAFSPEMVATLAGDRLQHDIALIPRDDSCAAIQRRIQAGWVVLVTFPREVAARREPFTADDCLKTTPAGARVLYEDPGYTVFGRG
jgi:hypothetical protein